MHLHLNVSGPAKLMAR